MSKFKVDPKPELTRREAFKAAASDLDATFVAGKLSSGDKVLLEHGPWRVILDTYILNNGQNPITYTRVRALYVAREDFTFRISQRNVFTRIAEMFGSRGLRVGDQELERKYTIKSSNDRRGQQARKLVPDRKLPKNRYALRTASWRTSSASVEFLVSLKAVR